MDRTAIFGPPGSGKAGRVVDAVREGAARDGGAFLVVPNLVDRSRFLRELAAAGDTMLDVEVGTWSALVQRIAAAPVRTPDAAMERVLVRQALERVPALAASVRWRGFAETARHHVLALRRASVWGGDARADAVAKLPGGGVEAWDTLAHEYGELLRERRLFDDAWLERRMRRRIEAGELGVGAVVAYQTLAPSRIQVRMLESIAQHVPVTASLPWRGGRGLHDAVSHLRDHWVATGWRIETTARSTSTDALEWFAAELFEPSPAAPPATATASGALAPLGFIECSGPRQEAEEVVAEVGRLLAAGVPIGSIAVTAARPEADAALLQGVFRRAGIPLASMLERRAPDVPVGRTLRDLLVAVEDDDPAGLVSALGSPGMPIARRSVDLADAALRGAPGVRTIAEAVRLPAVARALTRPVRELIRASAGGVGAPSLLDATLAVLADLLPPDEGALRLLTALAAVLESLAAAAGRRVDVQLGEIVAAVDGHSLRVPDRVDEGHVVLARILDLGTTRFDAVVVFGLHHGRFGASAERDDEQPAAARDLAHLAVTRARRALRCVRQHADSSGGMVAPHTVWLELERLAAKLPEHACTIRTRGLAAVVPQVEELVFASDAEVAVARAIGDGVEVIDVPAHVRTAIHEADRSPMPLQVEGDAGALLHAVERIGATELEAYARCPVQWLLRREAPLEDLDADRSSLDAGSYAHALLELGVPALLARAASGVSAEMVLADVRDDARRAARVDRAHVLHEHELARVEEQVLGVLRAEVAPERTRPDSVWVEVELTSTPRELREGEVAPVRPPWPTPGLLVDGVEIHGRVDRIDEYPDGLVLHDYKSGSRTIGPGKLVAEDHLQLGLYWLAIEQADGAPRPIAAPYRALPKGGEPWGLRSSALKEYGVIAKSTRPPKEEDIREVLDATHARARELVAGIRSGELDLSHIDPEARSTPCSYCSLQPICRIEERRA